jgi:Family of unknown function (DUF5763)
MVANSHTQGECCKALRKDGTPCQGTARASGYCWAHDPALAEQRRAGAARGGKNKAKIARLERMMPQDLIPVFTALKASLYQVYKGSLDPRQATAMASLATAMCRVLEVGELTARLDELESQPAREGGHAS